MAEQGDVPFLDPFSHDEWANLTLILFCRKLTTAELHAPGSSGTFGTIIETLRHINSGGYYRFLVSGSWPDWRGTDAIAPDLDVLAERAKDNATFWRDFIRRGFDPESTIVNQDRGIEYETKLGVILAQALHHGNHHRAEICVNISTFGKEPPDISAWRYAVETGRSSSKRIG